MQLKNRLLKRLSILIAISAISDLTWHFFGNHSAVWQLVTINFLTVLLCFLVGILVAEENKTKLFAWAVGCLFFLISVLIGAGLAFLNEGIKVFLGILISYALTFWIPGLISLFGFMVWKKYYLTKTF